MLPWIAAAALSAMIVATQHVPTPEELQASFDHGQKFYASGAFDQAIEKYSLIVQSRSRFLRLHTVAVTVGDISAPLQEVASYQIGNAYMSMAKEELEQAARERRPEDRQAREAAANALLATAAARFLDTESTATVPALRALARSQAVACYYQMRDYERTIEAAQQLIQRYPDSKYVVQSLYDIGWAYYDKGDYESSIAVFRDLVEQYPTGYRGNRALFQIGESYYNLQRYQEAIPYYQRLVEAQRLGQMTEQEILVMKREKLAGLVDETALDLAAKALIRMGQCYEQTGDYRRAGEAFETVAKHFSEEQRLAEEAYLRQADMHYNRGDFAACIAVYRRAIESDPDPADKARMQLLLANRFFETAHYPEAVVEYRRYRDEYPTFAAGAGLPVEGVGLQIAEAWFKHAETVPEEERLDPYRRAEAEIRSTLRAYPGSRYDVELRFNLGLALQFQEDPAKAAEAMEVFQGVIDDRQAGGYRQSALFQSARLYHDRKGYAEAERRYLLLIDEVQGKPEVDIARFELGVVRRDAGNWEGGIEALLSVRPESQLYARSRLEAGQNLLAHNQAERAIPALEAGLAAAPDDGSQPDMVAMFHYLLGAAHSRLLDHQAATDSFTRAIQVGSPAVLDQAYYGRGVALFKLEQFAAAAADLDRRFTETEIAAAAPRLLASAYAQAGQLERAAQVYQGLAGSTPTTLQQAEYLLALAEIDYRRGLYPDVIAAAGQLLRAPFQEGELPASRPYFVREKAHFLITDAHVRREEFEAAAASAETALQAFPAHFYTPDLWFLRGMSLLQLDRNEPATASLQRMVEDYPEHGNAGYARYYLAYTYYNRTMFTQALETFQQVMAQFPQLDVIPDAFYRAVECRFNMNDFAAAREGYAEFRRRYPEHPLAADALYNIGWCLMNEIADAKEAAQSQAIHDAFTAYVEQYPTGRHVPTARYTLAEIAYNAADYDRAYGMFRAIERDYPGTEAARRSANSLPDLQEAVAYRAYNALLDDFNRAVDDEDEDDLLAMVPRLEAIWRDYPNTASGVGARVNIAVIYQKLEEWERAVEIYDSVVQAAQQGNEGVDPNVLTLCERRSEAIKRKRL